MAMIGDRDELVIKSTRAISINANKRTVWKWLIQLGADRCGFFSYTFVERLLGYQSRHQAVMHAEFGDIQVGDVVRGSINEQTSIYPYNFKVIDVHPEKYLVLENWGTFQLDQLGCDKTRLIVRTRENFATTVMTKLFSYLMVALHYLMERRTLIGLKAQAETESGTPPSQAKDITWISSIILSELLIFVLILIGHGIVATLILAAVLSVSWLLTLFIFKPSPLYSIILLVVCLLCLAIA